VFTTSRPGNIIATCQDCHMPDRVGKGCDAGGAPVRPGDSVEHPKTGQGVHELTGGNALIPLVLASTVPASPNYDAQNESLLGQGPAALTLDLQAGIELNPFALIAGSNRAIAELKRAAAIQDAAYDPATGAASFRILNQTGHKLITGYPEGRRMFANVALYQGQTLVHEVNPYDAAIGTLKGLAYSGSSPPLGANESHDDALVYEAHSDSSYTGIVPNFHFLLATGHYKDNRIPPKGFRIAEAAGRMAEPYWAGAPAPGYFTAAEYAGGYDDVAITLPLGGDRLIVTLYYQTTSREYIEFLRDEINGTATSLPLPVPSGEAAAYIVQTDPFFGQLRAWGDTIWNLWLHNKDAPGAAPVMMARAVFALDSCQGQADGTPCEDGNTCTTGDTCAGGACQGGGMLACEDQNPCTDDACDPQAGCVHDFNTDPCEDGDLCNGPDVCAFGVCVPGATIYCFDNDPCTDDTCDPAVGCPYTPICGTGGGGGGGAGGGGAGGSAATSSGTGGSVPTSDPGEEDGGCGCATPGSSGAGRAAGVAAALALLALRRRRRR
jgi:MYXO-CTERM domain-containing protein